ncbi:BET4 [Candida oxycetoniae]|uniref:Geranylgeranyl transferase type-2 subunit alpha n=1 Tax=Candida oxycetoniae TaxID=497107 RepID=A0AAI9T1V1_9ASCO|nr:BET4 [Candida oxycetoniae]KAI3407053.2 BET4 [Candida oxycetoniae]
MYEKDLPKIAHYKELTSYLFNKRDSQTYDEETFKLTTRLLQLNPEFYTMWNFRREIIDKVYAPHSEIYIEILNDELNLILSLLKKFPKVYWIWNHRRWCLFKLVELKSVDWEFEFKTVGKMLELDQRNFHGWQYRRFVVENLEIQKTGNDKELEILNLNLKEFEYTTSKIQHDFSNFSAWHNRTKLIPIIYNLVKQLGKRSYDGGVDNDKIKLFESPLSILYNDLEILKTGIYMCPEDNSVWLYFCWLLSDKFFVSAFDSIKDYIEVLNNQLELIKEVNELEKEDTGNENVGCLRSLVYVHALINKAQNEDILENKEVVTNLKKLIELDSLRKHRYEDQLSGKVLII